MATCAFAQSPTFMEKSLKLLDAMLRCRALDEKTLKLTRQNKGGTFHISTQGHEMIGSSFGLALESKKDWGLGYYRDRAFAMGLGACPVELMGTSLGRATLNHSSGRMMPEHFADPDLRLICQSSVVGSQFLHAVGVAKSIQLKGLDEVVYVSGGEGSTSQGDFHEALNFSCLHKLPVIFVIQDNGWAISTPSYEQTAGGDIAKVVLGFPGLSVHSVDGGSFKELDIAVSACIEKGRKGDGPSLVVAKVPRLQPHSISDDQLKYKKPEDIEAEKKLDPITRHIDFLHKEYGISLEEIEKRKEAIFQEIEEASLKAQEIPFPDPSSAQDHVFKKAPQIKTLKEDAPAEEKIVMVDLINKALHEKMAEDPSMIVFGQDVARGKGGVFGATRGLTASFGDERCFNTPLAESSIIGIACGMAMSGYHKPVVEVQFADYLWTGINQLFNEVSSIHYRSNGRFSCPLVIRMPCGGYIQGGPYHSQNIEGYLSHCPGLKIAIPSNGTDAKAMLKAAIEDPNPTVFLENKGLYRQRYFSASREPAAGEKLPLGEAKIVTAGEDLTVVAWGMMVPMAKEVIAKLSNEGSIELIDLRSITPLDEKTILESVKKTGKVLILQEAPKNSGFGAEIAARIAEKAFDFLDAPIQRLCSLDTPVPYSKCLEEAVLPQSLDIEQAMKKLLRY